MKRAVGIRAEKDCFHWVVLERVSEDYAIVAHGRAGAPASYDESDSLKFYRENIQTLVREWKLEGAAIKFAETYLPSARSRPSGQKLDAWLKRARIEGVLIAALRDVGQEVLADKWQRISARIGSRSAKSYSETGEFRGVDLSRLPQVRQDLVTVAAAMLGERD